MWYIYILKCVDKSYYVGVSADLRGRLKIHNEGKGPNYTRVRRPVELVYFEEVSNKESAEIREIEIKKFGRKNKEYLIKHGTGVRGSLATKI